MQSKGNEAYCDVMELPGNDMTSNGKAEQRKEMLSDETLRNSSAVRPCAKE